MARRRRRARRTGPPHVALIIETSMEYGREILHGALRYVRENGPWTIFFEPRSLQDPAPPWLGDWDGDGIITTLYPRFSELIRATGIPTVDLDDQEPRTGPPTVRSDQRAIGALAAAHLIERGFERFGFFGYPEFEWSRLRLEAFREAVEAAGHRCWEYQPAYPVTWGHQAPAWEDEVERFARWIAGLPKPLGLMACNDFRGVQALDACRRGDVAVPEEVAVVGVDDEVLACELASPPLSSVIPDCRRIGYEGAALLARIMAGERRPPDPPPVPPRGIAVRQSSDVTAISDPIVAAALRFVRENVAERFGVDDVAEHAGVSRGTLNRRFRAATGGTLHDAVAATRIGRVKRLLEDTDLPLHAVAARSGFPHVEYLIAAFRKATGSTPGAFRRSRRGGGPL